MIYLNFSIIWNYQMRSFDNWGYHYCKIFQNIFDNCCQINFKSQKRAKSIPYKHLPTYLLEIGLNTSKETVTHKKYRTFARSSIFEVWCALCVSGYLKKLLRKIRMVDCFTNINVQKNADISKIKGALEPKVIFSETTYECILTCVPNFMFLAYL